MFLFKVPLGGQAILGTPVSQENCEHGWGISVRAFPGPDYELSPCYCGLCLLPTHKRASIFCVCVCVCDDYKYVLPYCPQLLSPQVTQELDCPSPPGTGSQGGAKL